MAGPVRRVKAAQASQRAASNRVVEEHGSGYVSTSMSDRRQKGAPPYYEDTRELGNVLSARFTDADPAAFIRVGAGLTINLQNFESLRIDCAVTIPCSRDSLDEGYQFAADFVTEKLEQEQMQWLGDPAFQKQSSGKGR